MEPLNYQKINNTIALACAFALIIFTGSIISKLFWQFLEKDNNLHSVQQLEKNPSETDINLPINLFGALDAPITQNHSNIESTRLNLALIGILYKKNQPFAIIKQENGKEKIYQIDDLITPSTKLKEMFPQYVILVHNGKIEKLAMKRKHINFDEMSNQSAVEMSNTSRVKLRHYLDVLKTNPQNLMEVLSVQPNYKNGKLRGFIIAPGQEKALFEELGFQKNDIILGINNNELNNLSQAIKLRAVFSQQKTFDFKIERQGHINYLTLNLN